MAPRGVIRGGEVQVRVALLGDVHANLPALEAVLSDAAARGAEAIWNVGDWVGYNAFPEEVVARLRRAGAISIVGNYDVKVLKYPRKEAAWRERKRPEKLLAFGWAYRRLSAESREYLASLPRQRRLEAEGRRVLLVHGSPASIDEHLYLDTPEERMRELAEMAKADLVVCGHSHRPFQRRVGEVLFVNTGSVGRQDDGDPRATYATLAVEDGRFVVEHHRVEYDVERAVAAIRRHGLPEAFAEMMRRGRKLDHVSPPAERKGREGERS